MEDIVKLIVDNGSYIILLAYFIFKDYRFNQNIIDVLEGVKEILYEMKERESQ